MIFAEKTFFFEHPVTTHLSSVWWCLEPSPPPILRWTITHPSKIKHTIHTTGYTHIKKPLRSISTCRWVQMARKNISTASGRLLSFHLLTVYWGIVMVASAPYWLLILVWFVRYTQPPLPHHTISSTHTASPLRYPESLLNCYTAGRTRARGASEGAAVHRSDHHLFFWCTVLE